MTLGTRLLKARKLRGYTQKELHKISGVKQGLISKLERGDQQSTTFVTELSLALNINHVWLATGDGQMLLNLPVSSDDEEKSPNDNMLKLQKLMSMLEIMTPDEIAEAYELVRAYQKIRNLKNPTSVPKDTL